MSFILDALKKSENERQRTIGPSLADAPVRAERTERPWWAVAVAALLVINLGVLIVVLSRNHNDAAADKTPASPVTESAPQASTPAATTPTPPPQAQAQQPQSERQASDPSVRSLAEEAGSGSYNEPYQDPGVAPYADAALSAAANVPAGPSIVRPIEAPAVAPLESHPTFPSRSPTDAANAEVLPTANSLAASGTRLPELHLDIHVYSDKPLERFVFVNMKKYLEGQALSEGPIVERITAEGVILNQQGLRFLLPRQ